MASANLKQIGKVEAMIQIQKCTVSGFRELVKREQIVCFGGGQRLHDICEAYDISEQLLYIVDKYKSGTMIELKGREVPVLSMEQVGQEIKGSIPVITSMRYVDEIVTELDCMEQCDQVPFYVPDLFGNESEESLENLERTQQIPKIIHYFWFGRGEIPLEFRKNIEDWSRKCPDYEIRRWDEDNYDISKNVYMRQAYEAGKWGFVPDYARLDVIFHHGGIYLDTDVEVRKPFDELLPFEMFCGFESVSQVNLGSGFGAVKGNRLLGAMLEQYEKEEFIKADGTLNMIPSPIYQTRVLSQFGLKRNGMTQRLGNAIILAPEYLSPVNEFGFGEPTKNTYSIHHYAATWYGDTGHREKERIQQNYRDIIRRMEQSSQEG